MKYEAIRTLSSVLGPHSTRHTGTLSETQIDKWRHNLLAISPAPQSRKSHLVVFAPRGKAMGRADRAPRQETGQVRKANMWRRAAPRGGKNSQQRIPKHGEYLQRRNKIDVQPQTTKTKTSKVFSNCLGTRVPKCHVMLDIYVVYMSISNQRTKIIGT